MKTEQKEILIRDLIVILAAGIMYLFVSNFEHIIAFIGNIFNALSSLTIGIVVALILNVPLCRLEKRLDKWEKRKHKNNRVIALVITYSIFLLIVVVLCLIVIPQLTSSIVTLSSNMGRYITTIINSLNNLFADFGIDFHISTENMPVNDLVKEIVAWINTSFEKIKNMISEFAPGLIGGLTGAISTIITSIINTMMAIIISVYLLLDKEKFLSNINKVMDAYLKPEWCENIRSTFRIAHSIFEGFIGGQLVEMGILTVMFFAVLTIFGMPYAFLISVIIAVTSIIPYFGATVGIIFGAILILADKGFVKMLIFIVVFEILQQLENNLIYPKVVGNSVGLPPFWVLLSLLFFGKLFGLIGMVVSAPVMALIYTLARDVVNERLAKRKININ